MKRREILSSAFPDRLRTRKRAIFTLDASFSQP